MHAVAVDGQGLPPEAIPDNADAIARTGYVTANGYLHRTLADGEFPPSGGSAPLGWPAWDVVDREAIGYVDDVWRDARDEVADLALEAAEKVLGESLDASRHRKLIDDVIDDLPRN